MKPSANKISKVVGSVVDYASKSTETENQTKDKLKLRINEKKKVQATHQMSEEWQ